MSNEDTTKDTTNTVTTAEPVAPATQKAEQVPSIGGIVHYVLDNGRYPGEHRPALAVKVNDAHEDQAEATLQLQVFTDATEDFDHNQPGSNGLLWKTSVRHDEDKRPNSWHWPEYA